MLYLYPGGGTVTLVTISNVGSGSGAHFALIVNASELVIFDPAGSMKHDSLAERGDVLYCANSALFDSFIDYHTRSTSILRFKPWMYRCRLRKIC